VLGTFPVSGVRVNRGASITLVLSDGRPPADTLAVSLFSLR
jgi:beta-lactam-binding protein with PASTA domain